MISTLICVFMLLACPDCCATADKLPIKQQAVKEECSSSVTTTPEESPRADTETPRSSSGEVTPSRDDAESASAAAAASSAAQGQPASRAPSPAAAAAALAALASSASTARLDSPRDAAALVSTTPAAEYSKQKVSFEPGVSAAAGGAAPAPAQAELTGASVSGSAARQMSPGHERPTSSSGGYRNTPGSHNAHAGARTGVAQGTGGLKYSNGNKLEVRVSAGGSDGSSDSGRTCCGCSRKVLWCALTVLLLVVMAGVGVGVGVSCAKGKQGAGAAKSAAAAVKVMPAMSVYGLMAHPSLPGATSDQRCRLWFGSEEVRCNTK